MKKWFRRFIDGAWILSVIIFVFTMLALLGLYFPIATLIVCALFFFVWLSVTLGEVYEQVNGKNK